ncbi:Type 1 phosphatases regulator ypi1 [Orbilia blumenaviensis]|uniref:Type 1 phosphatases regulator n=1 Tax=Orbilia blumenaviensis TaxID=1796055 RepID=A0AAV9U7N1_9PEZI
MQHSARLHTGRPTKTTPLSLRTAYLSILYNNSSNNNNNNNNCTQPSSHLHIPSFSMEGPSTTIQDLPASSTTTEQVSAEEVSPRGSSDGVLRLRGAHPERRRVTWTEEVVDNEGLGRKKTKICCIYHKPREFGESSSEESDSSSSSEEENDHGPTGESGSSGSGHPSTGQHKAHSCRNHKGNGKRRKNAYEKTPTRQKPGS